MNVWRESPDRLRLTAGTFGPRIQFIVIGALLAAIVAQTGVIAVWSYPILLPLILWLAVILWRGSVWVEVDRAYQRVTIEWRRLLGFVTFTKAVRELRELRAIPVTTKNRYPSFGGETTWTIHLMFGDDQTIRIGSVVNDARKVESVLDEISGIVGQGVTAAPFDITKVLPARRSLFLEILDTDSIVRVGQIFCLLTIALALYAAPTMSLFYIGLLVFGTLADWFARRSDE